MFGWKAQVAIGLIILSLLLLWLFLGSDYYIGTYVISDYNPLPAISVREILTSFEDSLSFWLPLYFIMLILSLAGLTLVVNGIYNKLRLKMVWASPKAIERTLMRIGTVVVASFLVVTLVSFAIIAYSLYLVEYEIYVWHECWIPDNCGVHPYQELYAAFVYLLVTAAVMCGIAGYAAFSYFRSDMGAERGRKVIR